MKRSEMVIDLAGVLTIELMDRKVFMNWDKVQDIANKILKEAEYNGMLPPTYMKQLDVTGKEYYPNGFPLNEWEPEDA